MSHHGKHLTDADKKPFTHSKAIILAGLPVGVLGLLVALIATLATPERGVERLAHSYLWAFVWILTISCGSLALCLIATLFRGGWHILIRRVWEHYATAFVPALVVLAIPLLFFAANREGLLYSWNLPVGEGILQHHHQIGEYAEKPNGIYDHPDKLREKYFGEHADDETHAAADYVLQHAVAADDEPGDTHGNDSHGEDGNGHHDDEDHDDDHHEAGGHGGGHGTHHDNPLIAGKRPYLNLPFWSFRVLGYMVLLGAIGYFFHRNSKLADDSETLDVSVKLTKRNERFTPVFIILFGVVATFVSFDLMMSLDPTWYSTMFGIQFFAGSMIAALSACIITLRLLQAGGYIPAVNVQHYHDLGKLLFAFVFFWTYVSFSQYMLIWYASFPGEIPWFAVRGAITVTDSWNAYSPISILLIFIHFIIPFAFLLSRHIKRNLTLLTLAAVWLLVAHAIHLFWIIMPEFDNSFLFRDPRDFFIDLGCFFGLAGFYFAWIGRSLGSANLIPVKDPRLNESVNHLNLY